MPLLFPSLLFAWIHQFKSYHTISPCSLSLNAYISHTSALLSFFPPSKLAPLALHTNIFLSFHFLTHFLLRPWVWGWNFRDTERVHYLLPASPETYWLSSLSSLGHLLLCGLPNVLPCHFDGSAGHGTISLMTWSQTLQSSLTKTLKLEGQLTCRGRKCGFCPEKNGNLKKLSNTGGHAAVHIVGHLPF